MIKKDSGVEVSFIPESDIEPKKSHTLFEKQYMEFFKSNLLNRGIIVQYKIIAIDPINVLLNNSPSKIPIIE